MAGPYAIEPNIPVSRRRSVCVIWDAHDEVVFTGKSLAHAIDWLIENEAREAVIRTWTHDVHVLMTPVPKKDPPE